MNVQPPISSPCSKSGKSVTQWKTSRSRVGSRSSSCARWSRRKPRTRATTGSSSATKSAVEPSATPNASSSLLGEELRDLRQVGQPLCSPLLRELFEPRLLGAGERPRHDDVADARRVLEDAELGAPRHLGRLLDLQPEAEVGLVGAVAKHRVAVREARERTLRWLDAGRLESSRRRTPPSRRARPPARRTPSRSRAGGTRTAGRRGDPRPASTSRSGSSGRSRRSCRAA